MTFPKHNKRVAAVGLALALGAAAALFIGAGAATACPTTPENDAIGNFSHDIVGVGTLFLDQDNQATTRWGFWACASPVGTSGSTHLQDNNSGTPGQQADAGVCNSVVGCKFVGSTGAEVGVPSTTTNAPFGSDSTTSASVATGAGTCAYVNGSCAGPSGGTNVGSITINEADVFPAPSVSFGCTYVNTTCVPVNGAGVAIGNSNSPTVTGTVAGSTVPAQNVPYHCQTVSVGTPTPPSCAPRQP